MAIEFRITRGARAGARERFEKSVITIGRHPMNDLRFDAAKDLDVSSRHAELRVLDTRYVLRDIGSTNGTFVNGEPLVGERDLRQGDILSFGADGPQAIFHLTDMPARDTPSAPDERRPSAMSSGEPFSPGNPGAPWMPGTPTAGAPPSPPPMETMRAGNIRAADVLARMPEPPSAPTPAAKSPAAAGTPPAPPRVPPPVSVPSGSAPPPRQTATATVGGAPARPRKNTEVRIAEAVQKKTGKLRMVVVALSIAVVGIGAVATWFTMQATKSAREQVEQLVAANDSIVRVFGERLAQTGVADAALKAAQADIQRLTKALRAQQAAGGDVSALSAEIRETQARTAGLSKLDFSAISAANKAAIVFIAVRINGVPTSGTGFNILPGGLIVTNRHVVQAANGDRADRIGVVFNETRGWKEATIEYVSDSDEIAILRLVNQGNYPVVSGIAREPNAVKTGDPVALLGYPLGTNTAGNEGDIDTLRPVASLFMGTVSKVLDDILQLDTYAAQGSSGSPVFDSRGLVVGVLYGAPRESGGRIIYTVPSARLATQLPRDAAGVIR
ncbi:MAG: trypsin-like peptidase domain-containing protein [Gemmatimonadaceae bacterium]